MRRKAAERQAELEGALTLEGLRRDAEELAAWMDEKRRQLDEGGKEVLEGGAARNAVKAQITRHAALVAELAANRQELARLKGVGTIDQSH